ncbi:dolichyl-phosphate-mannose--protein mannosyltransferase [Streptosporangium sp. NPDC050855]|uniref:dolichyl-phosphate-mannose--protein mannosyltransferase n=1 Tax=Streptosporangium sp. NPDC050855 TaxID=3366194 RepID=UPI0037A8FD9E
MPENTLWGWLGPLLVAALGGVLRFTGLGRPHAVVFDETYYVKDAWALIHHGVERASLGTVKDPVADRMIIAGNTDFLVKCTPPEADPCPLYVAHPPLGKWMIGAGEQLFGMTPFGWRFAAAVVGVASILILARTARRMTRSTMLGCLAGLLLAVEGLHLVLSRTALLDIFLMFWVLAGFACLVADRDHARTRLVDWYESSPLSDRGPHLGPRPWRIAAGLCLGAACAVKWSGVFFLIAFTALTLAWDAGARRAVGLRRPYTGMIHKDLTGTILSLGLLPVLTYIASWAGWFASAGGWGRNWAQATSQGPGFFVFDSLRSWLSYHVQVLGYHTGLEDPHPYQSAPWTWPLLSRPVAFHYQTPKGRCGAGDCAEAVLGVGTPVIWYGGLAALITMIAWYVATRDWRAGAVLLAYAAGWLPWFYYALADNRTMYLFYAITMVPFMILALTMAAGLVVGRAGATPNRRALGAAVVGAFTLLALVNLWWLYPVLVAEVVPHSQWWARMMFRGWV